MNNEIDKIITRIPLVTGIVYILGFICSSIYFGSFGFSSYDFINAQYFETGALICVLTSLPIIVISYNYKERTDNFMVTKGIIPGLFHRTFELSWFCLFVLLFDKIIGSFKNHAIRTFIEFLVGLLIYSGSFLMDFYLTSYAAREIPRNSKNKWYIAFIFLEIVFIIVVGNISADVYVAIVVVISALTFTYLGLEADKKASSLGLIMQVGTAIMLLFMYSNYVLPDISTKYGGFETKAVIMMIKPEKEGLFGNVGIKTNSNGLTEKLSLLGESGTSYFIELGSTYLQFRKEDIEMVITAR